MMKTPNTPLLEARLASGLTQKQVADILEIDQGHLSRIERCQCQPKPDLAAVIASKFQCLDEMMVLYPERYMVVGKAKKARKK